MPIFKNFLVGFFNIPGVDQQVIVETPLTGHGPTDYRALAVLVRKLYPQVPDAHLVRVGSIIESRDPAEMQDYINPLPGMTIRQLFPENPTQGAEECFRFIGSVFFSGQACRISIRYHYEKGTVSMVLIDRLTKGTTRFTNQINASLLVKELEPVLKEIFGKDAKDLQLRVRKHESENSPALVERVPNLKDQVVSQT